MYEFDAYQFLREDIYTFVCYLENQKYLLMPFLYHSAFLCKFIVNIHKVMLYLLDGASLTSSNELLNYVINTLWIVWFS